MGLQGCVPRFIARHGSLILTILAGIGLVGTTVVTARQAPKAEKELREELHWKIHQRVDEMMDEAEANGHGAEPEDWTDDEHAQLYDIAERDTQLTLTEKIKVAGPVYAPVILLGLFTLGCMAGAQVLNARQQAVLIGAYALLQKEYGAYRQEIREEYGIEADKKALSESKKKIASLEAEVKRLDDIKGIRSFGLATLPGVIFRSDMANIERAFLHFNRNLILRGWADLEELYSFLGLPEDQWEFVKRAGGGNLADGEKYGWNCYLNEVNYGISWVDYRIREVKTAYGDIVYMIDFDVPPYMVEGPDYDEESPGIFYNGYDPQEAVRLLKMGAEQIPLLIDSTTHYVGAPMLCGW